MRPLVVILALLVGVPAASTPVHGDDALAPIELVHVPVDELNVLLATQKRGLVLEYRAYRALFEEARKRAASLSGQPPVDGTLVQATGRIDLATQSEDDVHAALIEATYRVRVLADGPRSVSFRQQHVAFESVTFEGQGLFEEWKHRPRLRFEGAGDRTVHVRASALVRRKGRQRLLHIGLPPASSMAFDVTLPPGVRGEIRGEGAPVLFETPANAPEVIRARPARNGTLRVAFAPASRSREGPPILDSGGHVLHRIGDGVVQSRFVVAADIYRAKTDTLVLSVPATFAVHALSGKGVARFTRSEDRTEVLVTLQKPVTGRVTLTLQGEQAYRPGPAVVFPAVTLRDAVWQWMHASVDVAPDVRVRAVRALGGRRMRSAAKPPYLRYALARKDARLEATVEAGETRTEAFSTYYLNLAEAGRDLLMTTTWRVIAGTVFALRPRVPVGFELRTLQINGQTTGFSRDLREDGTVEILLQRGVPAGSEVRLAATLDHARTDWVPDGTAVEVPFRVPSAGASREEGLVGIGADAAFEVLEQNRRDLVAVGAGDLTARGITAEGLVYGYRLDGDQPEVTYEVRRRTPVVEAHVVSLVQPAPRRLAVDAVVIHDVRRAGIRMWRVDVPSWAGDEVRFDSPLVRATERVGEADRRGMTRWQVTLRERAIGRHAMVVRYHRDFDEDDWRLPAGEPLVVRVPVERQRAAVVVQRAVGLEVHAASDGLRSLEVDELPPEAPVDPQSVLDVVSLDEDRVGLALSVRKHDSAAVLNALATSVSLFTAVAKEGVLRTRASIELLNIDRQFLEVALPPGSALIGALADGLPVKPLVDPRGVVLVPIATAHAADARARVALTYETDLGEPLGSAVDVPAPVFPGLEVLQTTHEVAFDKDMHVASVSGDFGTQRASADRDARPWIAALWERWTRPTERAGAASASDSGPLDRETTGATADEGKTAFEEGAGHWIVVDERVVVRPPSTRTETVPAEYKTVQERVRVRNDDGSFRFEMREKKIMVRPAATRNVPVPGEYVMRPKRVFVPKDPYRTPGGAVEPGLQAPDLQESTDPPAPAPATPPSSPVTAGTAFPGRSASADAAGGPPNPNADPGEGRAAPPRPRFRGRSRLGVRRKGLLSLDVPVVLGPHRVSGTRMGSGGVMQVSLVPDRPARGPVLWSLALIALSLWLGRSGMRAKVGVVVGALAMAGLVAWIVDAGGLAAAFVNAATGCAAVWAVASVVRRFALPRAAVSSALVLWAVAGTSGALADEPRPRLPDVKEPGRVFVPYDPAAPGSIPDSARVFLPFDTWQSLFRAAHPALDPELVRLGRMVTVSDVVLRVTMGEQSARGTAEVSFTKRGDGVVLTAWPFGGIAITEARLDDQPVQLLLTKGVYRLPVTAVGDHTLNIRFRVPVVEDTNARRLALRTVPFSGARLHVRAGAFDGIVQVKGAGRVETRAAADSPSGRWAVAHLGHARTLEVVLRERRPAMLPEAVRMRAQTRTIHSVRHGGTMTRVSAQVHVLQGAAPFVDFGLPAGASVLDVQGGSVASWDTIRTGEGDGPPDTLRLTLAKPASSSTVKCSVRVRASHACIGPGGGHAGPAVAWRDERERSSRRQPRPHASSGRPGQR